MHGHTGMAALSLPPPLCRLESAHLTLRPTFCPSHLLYGHPMQGKGGLNHGIDDTISQRDQEDVVEEQETSLYGNSVISTETLPKEHLLILLALLTLSSVIR